MPCHSGKIDVLGLGAVTVDDRVYVDRYPPPDAKVSILGSQRECGGLTGTALVAVSRLGGKSAYAGVLGADELSAFIIAALQQASVDTSHVLREPTVRPIHSFIVVDETNHTRNIFVDLRGIDPGSAGILAGDPWPSEQILLSTKVLLVDHVGVSRMLRAAQVCRANGIPIVADFENAPGPEFPQLLELVDHLILSQAFAEKLTGFKEPAQAAATLWNANRDTVAITAGSKGCWHVGKASPGSVRHQPAFEVDAVDTTGCGDVFHGAYALALAEQRSLDDRIAFASAAAALKASRRGGQSTIPIRSSVDAFIRSSTQTGIAFREGVR